MIPAIPEHRIHIKPRKGLGPVGRLRERKKLAKLAELMRDRARSTDRRP